ncbi:RNA methyltransferase [soil metagenome]
MRIVTLTSSSNPLLKRIRSLHERQARHKAGLFLIEGEKVLLAAFSKDIEIEAVVMDAAYYERGFPEIFDDNLIELNVVDSSLFKTLSTTTSPCNVVAIAKTKASRSTSELLAALDQGIHQGKPLTVVLCENLQDPGNLGTIIRSTLAFGAQALILSKGSVDLYNPKVVRSAMGALFDLPITHGEPIGDILISLKQAGFEVIALNPEAKQSIDSLEYGHKVAILLGNEGNGLTAEADAKTTKEAHIEISAQVESLNVAVAASVVLFHINKSKRTS